jgi:hypothetical protein
VSKQRHEWISTDCPMIEAELDAAQERIAELEAALRYYSEPANYDDDGVVGSEEDHPPHARCGGCSNGFVPDRGTRARAALAGSQGGGGEDGQDVACTETTAPECRDGWHAIRPGEGACGCGENRMELML